MIGCAARGKPVTLETLLDNWTAAINDPGPFANQGGVGVEPGIRVDTQEFNRRGDCQLPEPARNTGGLAESRTGRVSAGVGQN